MTAEQVIEEKAQEQPQAQEHDDANQEIEIVPDEAPEQAEAEPEAQEERYFDPRTDKVEFSTPEQQEKFNYVYKQVKQSDARNQMLTDLLQEQQRQLDELKGRFSQTDEAEAERILMGKIKAARDEGNDDAELRAIKDLAEFIADKKNTKVSKPEPPARGAAIDATPADVSYVHSLMTETDDLGRPVRPWLNENHPDFNNAINKLEKIAEKYADDPAALQKSLAELDRAMTEKKEPPKEPTKPQTRAPNPMAGGNLTNHKPKAIIKMTKQELAIAKKLGVDPKRYAAKRDEINKRGR